LNQTFVLSACFARTGGDGWLQRATPVRLAMSCHTDPPVLLTSVGPYVGRAVRSRLELGLESSFYRFYRDDRSSTLRYVGRIFFSNVISCGVLSVSPGCRRAKRHLGQRSLFPGRQAWQDSRARERQKEREGWDGALLLLLASGPEQ
jgi:hypothetical protein